MPSHKKFFIKTAQHENKVTDRDVNKGLHKKRLSASDVYNCELWDVNNQDKGNNNCSKKLTSTPLKSGISSPEKEESVASELMLSNLKTASESSLSSSLGSTGSYYDSINTDSNMDDESKLMHVEVEFEWSPIPSKEIRYLPPAAHMWNLDHTLSPDKRLPPVRNALYNVGPAWIPSTKSAMFGHQTIFNKDKISKNSSNIPSHSSGNGNLQSNKYQCPADSLEDDHHRFEAMGKMRSKLKGMNGAVRVKNVDRPSVLSMVQGPNNLSRSKELLYDAKSRNISPKASSVDQDSNRYETNITDSLDRPAAAQIPVGRRGSASVQCENAPVTNTNADLDSQVRQILARIAASAR